MLTFASHSSANGAGFGTWKAGSSGSRENDVLYVKCIWRENLNATAGKSYLTIGGHRREILANTKRSELIGKTPSFKPQGPFPLEEQVEMGVIMDMMFKSLMAKEKIQKWVQFDTLRHIRSTYSKVYQSSPAGVYEAVSFAQDTGRVRPTACPTQSKWVLDALRGMEMMMCFDSQVDHAILAEAMLDGLRRIQADAEAVETMEEENLLWKIGAFI